MGSHHPLAIMARYPDVVTLTGLLADRTWTELALNNNTHNVNRFHTEARRRLKIPYEAWTAYDPLVRWRESEQALRQIHAQEWPPLASPP